MDSPKYVFLRLDARLNPKIPMLIAPAITNARDGSHRPAISRNPITFDGSDMPDIIRPRPNTKPVMNARRILMMEPIVINDELQKR